MTERMAEENIPNFTPQVAEATAGLEEIARNNPPMPGISDGTEREVSPVQDPRGIKVINELYPNTVNPQISNEFDEANESLTRVIDEFPSTEPGSVPLPASHDTTTSASVTPEPPAQTEPVVDPEYADLMGNSTSQPSTPEPPATTPTEEPAIPVRGGGTLVRNAQTPDAPVPAPVSAPTPAPENQPREGIRGRVRQWFGGGNQRDIDSEQPDEVIEGEFREVPGEPGSPAVDRRNLPPRNDLPVNVEVVDREGRNKSWYVKAIMEEGYAKPARERDYARVAQLFEGLRQLYFKEAEWGVVDEMKLHVTVSKEQIRRAASPYKGELKVLRGQSQQLQELAGLCVAQGIDIASAADDENIVLPANPEIGRGQTVVTVGQFKEMNQSFDLKFTAVTARIEQQQQPYIDDLNSYLDAEAAAIGMDPAELRRQTLEGDDLSLNRSSLLQQAEKQLWEDRYGTITFSDQDRQEIEAALGQYMSFIESKIGFPDPEGVLRNLKRIREVVARAYKREGMDEVLAETLADNAEARLVPFLHNEFFARVGDINSCSQLKAYLWKNRGRERILALFENVEGSGYDPAIIMKGLELLAHDRRYLAYYRPFGPRHEFGQAAYAQSYLREGVKDEFISELMHWQIKESPVGASPITNERVSDVNRKKVTWQQSTEQFNNLYNRHSNERWEGESDVAYQRRKTEVKKAAELAMQFNLFLGHQAEMRGASIITSNGDYLHRRYAEKFVKFAIRREMDRHNINPLVLQKELTDYKVGERTPRLTNLFRNVVNNALDRLDQMGAAAYWEAGGRRYYIEDIIDREDVRIASDAFLAVDYPTAAMIFSEENKAKAAAGESGYYPMIRRVLDPRLEFGKVEDDVIDKKRVAQLVDFVVRLQTESSQAVYERFGNRMYQGSQGAGYLTETRVFDMRSVLESNYNEYIKYARKLVAYLPEIYSAPVAFGCNSAWELVQTIRLGNPKEGKVMPEVFENFSGEKLAEEYRIMGTEIRARVQTDVFEKDGSLDRSFFHEPFSNRESFLHSISDNIGRHPDKSDEFVENVIKNHFPKLQELIVLYRKLLNDTRKMEPADPVYWAMGIFYDEFMDWFLSDADAKESCDKGGLKAYTRFEPYMKYLNRQDKGEHGTGRTMREKIKEKLVFQLTPPIS